jgi:hypothetical protein
MEKNEDMSCHLKKREGMSGHWKKEKKCLVNEKKRE